MFVCLRSPTEIHNGIPVVPRRRVGQRSDQFGLMKRKELTFRGNEAGVGKWEAQA